MDQAVSTGIISLYEDGAVVTILIIQAVALAGLIWYLIRRNQDLGDKCVEALQNNTVALNNLKNSTDSLERAFHASRKD